MGICGFSPPLIIPWDDGHCLLKMSPSDLASSCVCLNVLLCPPLQANGDRCHEAFSVPDIQVLKQHFPHLELPGTQGVIQLYNL